MPKRKRREPRRRRSKTLFVYRKRPSRRRKKLALKSHNFVERVEDTITLNGNTLNSAGNLVTNYQKHFQFSDIAQVASYKDLFDDYVLNKVVAEIRFDYDLTNSDNAAGYQQIVNPIYPMLLIKTDHNDAATGETWATMKESERSRLVQLKPGVKISHVLKPAIQMETYKTALASGYAPKWGQQLRTIDDTVPHYGLKIQVQTAAGSAHLVLGKINIMYKYYFTMKNSE